VSDYVEICTDCGLDGPRCEWHQHLYDLMNTPLELVLRYLSIDEESE
jgi:hypothetical protein